MEVSPHFLQGVDAYVLCVCVRTHTHTTCGVLRCEPGVSGRDTWRARKKFRYTIVIVYIYTVRFTKYTFIYICWATGRSLD